MSRPSERREEQRAGERIDRRVNDGPEAGAERAEREPRGRLPTDAVNNVLSAVSPSEAGNGGLQAKRADL